MGDLKMDLAPTQTNSSLWKDNILSGCLTSPLRGWLSQTILKGPRKPIGTWDKEEKDGREIEHARGTELTSGNVQITNMAKQERSYMRLEKK